MRAEVHMKVNTVLLSMLWAYLIILVAECVDAKSPSNRFPRSRIKCCVTLRSLYSHEYSYQPYHYAKSLSRSSALYFCLIVRECDL